MTSRSGSRERGGVAQGDKEVVSTPQLPELKTRFATIVKRIKKSQTDLEDVDPAKGEENDSADKITIHDIMEMERIDSCVARHLKDLRETAESICTMHRQAGTPEEIDAVEEEEETYVIELGKMRVQCRSFEVRSKIRKNEPGEAGLGALRQARDDLLVLPPKPSTPDLVKLPQHELLKFNGNYSEWPSFWDQFQSAVDSREGLAEVNKLIYIRGCFPHFSFSHCYAPTIIPTPI